MDKNKTIAVVMGGPSAEGEISLATGKSIAIALRERGYQVKELFLKPRNFSEQLKASGADVRIYRGSWLIWRGRTFTKRLGNDGGALYRFRRAGLGSQHE